MKRGPVGVGVSSFEVVRELQREALDVANARETWRPRRCPFCATSGSAMQKRNGEHSTRWFVHCVNCGATGPHRDYEDAARRAWDRRGGRR